MNVTFSPSVPRGRVSAPPSKSMAHRLLLCAGLAPGESLVENVSFSQDVLATLACLRALGAAVRCENRRVFVHGFDPFAAGSAVLPCCESGSTLRFFLPLCLLSGREMTLTGSERLLARPLSAYEALCRERGFLFARQPAALTVCGRLAPGPFAVSGSESSQFLSGLLFALPLLQGESTLTVLPPQASRPYVALTLSALSSFGIAVQKDGDTYHIPGKQAYVPCAAAVEGDWSNAALFFAMNALGGSVTVDGLLPHSLQADRVCLPYLDALRRGFAALDLSDCPDLGPVLFAAAALLHGGRFTGVCRLRQKESDRIAAMQAELAKLGITAEASENELTVRAAPLHAPSVPLCSHNDHRVAMALSLLLLHTGGTLTGAEAVQKSWPEFFETLQLLGVQLKGAEP